MSDERCACVADPLHFLSGGLKVVETFDAAHHLPNYPGDCAKVHGHTWKVVLSLDWDSMPELQDGMLLDLKVLKGHLRGILKTLDHGMLNEVLPARYLPPTAENIGHCIVENFARLLRVEAPPPVVPPVITVEVWETATSCATVCLRGAW